MTRDSCKGSITIFLSLTCILFLSLICTVAESARMQGARTQAANITGMGTFSLLGEYERGLLERYSIFSLDASYGHGSFQIEKADQRLERFLLKNANPKEDNSLTSWCFDPWNLDLTQCRVDKYALLTDDNGEPFYQQAVAYMKVNAAVFAADKVMEYVTDVDEIKKQQEEYEKDKKNNDSRISGLEKQKQQKISELESEAGTETSAQPYQALENPLDSIKKLRKKNTLEIVTWDKEISEKEIPVSSLPSKKKTNRGNLKIEKKYGGTVDNALFREYLLLHFPNYLSGTKCSGPQYQLEYILGGKETDKKNLNSVVMKLLAIREGMNYLYCVKDMQISAQADALSAALTGFLAMPALTVATKHALLLALAYGESLIDLRILLDGGRVPLAKSKTTWSLSLENLGRVTEILEQGAKEKGDGMTYQEYLRILLYLGSVSQQKVRALDMIQIQMRSEEASPGFKAENCIVAVQTSAQWKCSPVFYRLPQAVLGSIGGDVTFTQEGSISY